MSAGVPERSLFRSGGRCRCDDALRVFHQSGHRKFVVLLSVLRHARGLDILVYGPQRDVCLGINDYQPELSYCPVVFFGEADLKHEVCVGGSGHHFISSPVLHGRVELVVRAVGAAAVYGILGLIEEGFFSPVGDENLFRASDLCGDRCYWRS